MPAAPPPNPVPPSQARATQSQSAAPDSTCPDLARVEGYVDGGLETSERKAIAAHLLVCAECGLLAGEMRENLQLASSLRGVMRTSASTMPAAAPSVPNVPGYEIISELGRGGMGVVYEARQLSTRRTIALKVLHGSLAGSGEHETLLQREAWAMARLDHPGIAAIYEAGRSSDGRPFVAMEFVRGKRLGEGLAARTRSPSDTVRIFLSITRAVAHAHLRGVIHRDLKPSNILLSSIVAAQNPDSNSGLDTPKILDFGLARIAEEATAARGEMTRDGRVAGTPAYMSPEQAEGRSREITSATDVYALGVMLFEALTGQLPYEVSRTSIVAAAKTIATAVPRNPGAIDRRLKGDLETIILKALAKDTVDRYPDAGALADDLEAFLTDRPIEAARPSSLRKVALFTRRHRVASFTVAGIALLVVGFSIAMTVLYVQSQGRLTRAIEAEAKQRAATRRAIAEATAGVDLRNVLADAAVKEAKSLPRPTRSAIDLAVESCMNGPADPAVRATGLSMLSSIYVSLGDTQQAKACLERCLELRKSVLPADAPEIAEALSSLSEIASLQGKSDEAIASARAALAIATEKFGEGHAHVSNEEIGLIHALTSAGKLDEAARHTEQLINSYEQGSVALYNFAETANAVAGAMYSRDLHAQSVPLLRDSIEAMQRHGDGDNPGAWSTRSNLALHLLCLGKYDEALGLITETLEARQRLLPPGSNGILSTQLVYAMALAATGKLAEAAEMAHAVAATRSKSMPQQSPVLLRTQAVAQAIEFLLDTPDSDRLLQSTLAAVNGRGSATEKHATLQFVMIIVGAAPSAAPPARAEALARVVRQAEEAPLSEPEPQSKPSDPIDPSAHGHGQPLKKAPM